MRFVLGRLTIFSVAAALVACQPHSTGQTRVDANGPAGSPQPSPAASADRALAVGKIDGEVITQGDVDDAAKGALMREQNEYLEKLHDLRAQTLDTLIDQKLVAKKAKAENLSVEDYLKREVYAKVGAPADEELKALYDQAVAAGKELPPFPQIKGEIAQFITEKKVESEMQSLHQKLRTEAKVEVTLPPLLLPKVEVAAIGPSQGDEKAPVTIVEFSDYQCPYCSRAEPIVKNVMEAYKGKVRLVYREFPLGIHDHAQKAAEAALCAQDQGKYWEMHEKLFANQHALEIEQLKGYAKDLSLDQQKFDKCLDGNEKATLVAQSQKAGEEAGVNGTPAFFVNGRPLSGAQPFERFKEIIDAELAAKN